MQESQGPQETHKTSPVSDGPHGFEYDHVAYPGAADQSIHPRNLEVTAAMFGARPAPLKHCRVLEIGCADGTNLLPFADEFRDSRFLGVDLAKDRILIASEVADESGLANVEFRCADVVDLNDSLGTFDYILCPGIYSWVGEAQRQAIMRICRECLAPGGIAAISYNTLPGWNWNRSVREFIRQTTGSILDPQKRITAARNSIDFLAAHAPTRSIHSAHFRRVRDRLSSHSDAYLYHDYITDHNTPFYFSEFTERAAVHGLKFIGEADFRHSSGFGLDPDGRTAVARTPPEHREQLLDFLLNTCYRSSMLCHVDCELVPRVQHEWIGELRLVLSDPMEGFTFDSNDSQPLTLPFSSGAVTVTDPRVKTALRRMMDLWPRTVTLDDLFSAVQENTKGISASSTSIDSPETLARTMLALYGAGLVRPMKTVPTYADDVSRNPRATAVVRAAAEKGTQIVNQWHENISGLSADETFLLSRLDGSLDAAALVDDFRARFPLSIKRSDSTSRFVQETLKKFAKKRLLVD